MTSSQSQIIKPTKKQPTNSAYLLDAASRLEGKIERKMSGELCINGIRIETYLSCHLGQNCSIIVRGHEGEIEVNN